jgi:hypothetical protein
MKALRCSSRALMSECLEWYGARFRQKFTLEDAIGSHACSLETSMHVTNDIPLGCSLLLPFRTVNCVQTLKAFGMAEGVVTPCEGAKADGQSWEQCGPGEMKMFNFKLFTAGGSQIGTALVLGRDPTLEDAIWIDSRCC